MNTGRSNVISDHDPMTFDQEHSKQLRYYAPGYARLHKEPGCTENTSERGQRMSKRKKSPLGKKIEFDSFQALADYINDNLVQVGCENWSIVPAGNAVHI